MGCIHVAKEWCTLWWSLHALYKIYLLACVTDWMKMYIWRIHTSTQNVACLIENLYMAQTHFHTQNVMCLNENLYTAHAHFHTKPCMFEWQFICCVYTLPYKTLRVWMKIFIWRIPGFYIWFSTQNLACSQRQINTVHYTRSLWHARKNSKNLKWHTRLEYTRHRRSTLVFIGVFVWRTSLVSSLTPFVCWLKILFMDTCRKTVFSPQLRHRNLKRPYVVS